MPSKAPPDLEALSAQLSALLETHSVESIKAALKRPVGRPAGSGINDRSALFAMAHLIRRGIVGGVSAAAREMLTRYPGQHSSKATIKRLSRKYRTHRLEIMASVEEFEGWRRALVAADAEFFPGPSREVGTSPSVAPDGSVFMTEEQLLDVQRATERLLETMRRRPDLATELERLTKDHPEIR